MAKRHRLASPISLKEEAEAMTPPQLQFFVRMFPNGNNIVIQGSTEDTVKSVHERIETRSGIPVRDQRLIHAGKQLRWEQTLGECGIQNDATLQLVAHLRSSGEDSSIQEKVVGDMFSLVWRLLFYGEGTSAGDSDADTLSRLMKMIFKLNAFKAFMYKKVPLLLVNLCKSEIPGNSAIADSAIGLFLELAVLGTNSLFKKGLHVNYLCVVMEFCKLLRVEIGDDCILYQHSLISLWIVLEECAGDQNPNQKIMLPGVFSYVHEVMNQLSIDLDLSVNNPKKNPNLLWLWNFRNLIEFLFPLTYEIEVEGLQVWEASSRIDEEEDEDQPSFVKEIYHLRLMYFQLLYKLEARLQVMDDSFDNKEEGEGAETEGLELFLPILNLMSILSKLLDGAKEMFRGIFMRRGRILSVLINLYTERGVDYGWIVEHKSVLSFEARRSFAMVQFPGIRHNPAIEYEISIERSNILVESFLDIMHVSAEALRDHLPIKFVDEEGEGEGVVREWFLLVCQELYSPRNALFVPCPNDPRRFFPNPASNVNPLHLEYFTFCGRIIALALMNEVQVGIAFDRVFFKQLAGERITLEDIHEADPDLYNSYKKILEMDVDSIDSGALGLTFIREVEESGHRKMIELCPGGERLVVNSKNREKYVDLLIHNQFVTSISEQVSHFAKGFGEIIIDSKLQQFFQILDLEDFDGMLYGTENAICVEDWKAHTQYVGYKEIDPQISWFWEVVGRMSAEKKKNLLFFWTSLKYLPLEGFEGLNQNLQISKSSGPDYKLPSSQTCFYQLHLPLYPSIDVMEESFQTITQEFVSCSFGIN